MPRPPPAKRVARRAVILAGLTCRGNLDGDARRTKAVSQRLDSWLRRIDLGQELGGREAAVLHAPLGALSREAEGLAVVAWALKRFALPPHDRKVDAFAVTDAVGLLADPPAVMARPKLRPGAELSALREVLYAVHVRLVQFRRRQQPAAIAHHFEPRWLATLGVNVLGPDGDLSIDGKPLMKAPAARCQECLAITGVRHQASIWLAGEYPVYEDTPADT